MKKTLLTIGLAIFFLSGLFADGKPTKEEWRNMSRAERKAYREAELAKQHDSLMVILESKQWVLEANRLQDRYGNSVNIQSNLNFIGVSEENATVQLGSNHTVGHNGVGGVTVDGRVNKYEVTEVKRANSGANVQLSVSGAAMGHADVTISVSPSGQASATLRSIDGSRITYHGQIVPLSESRVYKGQTLY